jgi:hypothetical protein
MVTFWHPIAVAPPPLSPAHTQTWCTPLLKAWDWLNPWLLPAFATAVAAAALTVFAVIEYQLASIWMAMLTLEVSLSGQTAQPATETDPTPAVIESS